MQYALRELGNTSLSVDPAKSCTVPKLLHGVSIKFRLFPEMSILNAMQ